MAKTNERIDSERTMASTAFPAVVTGPAEAPGRLMVRLIREGRQAVRVAATLALPGGHQPAVGDRVLVLSDGHAHYLVGVLHPVGEPTLELRDGARATVADGALELRDETGRLLLRYGDGTAELSAPTGDLALLAPSGNIRLDAAGDVQLRADQLNVVTKRSRLQTGEATVTAGFIATTARRLAHNVERYELTANRLVETTRDTFREVTGLLQTKVGRARHLVEGVFSLQTRRTMMKSDKDTSIDGRRILLG